VADLRRLPELVRVDARTDEEDLSRCALLGRRWALLALECLHVIGQGELRHEWEARVQAAAADAYDKRARREAERECRDWYAEDWSKPGDCGHADDWDTEDEVALDLRELAEDSEMEESSEEEGEWQWADAIGEAAAALGLLLGNMALPALRVLSLDAPALTWQLPLAGLQHLVLRVTDDEEGGGTNAGMLGAPSPAACPRCGRCTWRRAGSASSREARSCCGADGWRRSRW